VRNSRFIIHFILCINACQNVSIDRNTFWYKILSAILRFIQNGFGDVRTSSSSIGAATDVRKPAHACCAYGIVAAVHYILVAIAAETHSGILSTFE
jgi:hypothetical protein